MIAAPAAMKTARSTRAIRTPTSSTRCWYCDGHRELRHDQDEDEEVVDAQRLLGDEAREELPGGLAAAEEQQADAEERGEGDPDDRPDSGLLDGDLVRLAADEEVDGDQGAQTDDGQDPQGQGNIHCASGSSLRQMISVVAAGGLFRPAAEAPCRADAPGSGFDPC